MDLSKMKSLSFVIGILLVAVSPVCAQSGKFSVGAIYGSAWSIAGEALPNFDETKFESGGVTGLSIMYTLPSFTAYELCIEKLDMDLVELGENFGTLKNTSVIFLIKMQGMPEKETGFAGHGEIGCGISFNSFDKGPFITGLENIYGAKYNIETDDSFVWGFGLGPGYFISKNVSIYLDGRFWFGSVNTTWEVSGEILEEFDKFVSSTVQVLLGVKYWF